MYNTKIFAPAVFLLIFITALFSCDSPTISSPAEKGSLTIIIKDEISRSILPDVDMTPAYYRIEGTGPNSAHFIEEVTNSLTRNDLVPGPWTLTVEACNNNDTVIGSGSAAATVEKDISTSVSITLEPYDGTGALNLWVNWPVGILVNPEIEAVLTPQSGSPITLDFTVSGNQASYSGSDIETGYHSLTIKLLENGSPVIGAMEVVRIAHGATSSGTFSFTDLEEPLGNIIIEMTPDWSKALNVSLLGSRAFKEENRSVPLRAEVADYEENLNILWYVNGELTGSGPTFTLDDSWDLGHYRVDVTAFSIDGSRAGYDSTQIEVVESGSLTGTFRSLWRTDNYSVVNQGIRLTIPLDSEGTYDFVIDWGDGYAEHITEAPQDYIVHAYEHIGDYEVSIYGLCEGFGNEQAYYASSHQHGQLLDILQWGDVKLHDKGFHFYNYSNLEGFSAIDSPDLSHVTDMTGMFYGCTQFDEDISGWDTSGVQRIDKMFGDCSSFTCGGIDISTWNWDMSSIRYYTNVFKDSPLEGAEPAWYLNL